MTEKLVIAILLMGVSILSILAIIVLVGMVEILSAMENNADE